MSKVTTYIYTMEMCPACDKLKKDLKESHTTFQERKADRLHLDPRIFDDIDKEAFLVLQMQNLKFPVRVEIKDSEYIFDKIEEV